MHTAADVHTAIISYTLWTIENDNRAVCSPSVCIRLFFYAYSRSVLAENIRKVFTQRSNYSVFRKEVPNMKATNMNKNAIPTAAKVFTSVDTKKRVYICSPFRPVLTDPILRANELIDNLKLAKDACTLAVLRGCEPVALHLYYPQFLNDDDEYERQLGMELGLRTLRSCDEIWIISPRISSGISAEIKEAQKCGIPVLVFTAAGFRKYNGNGDMTDNCYADMADGVVEQEKHDMTLRELLVAVAAYKNEEKSVIASYDDIDLKMKVFSDGNVKAKRSGHTVTFDLADCTDYTYRSAVTADGGATPTHLEADLFLDLRWEIRLIMEAGDRFMK